MYRKIPSSYVFLSLFVLFLSGICVAADYQSMTTEELSNLRGTMYNTHQEERDAFRAEWMNRINQMTDEEKAQFLGPAGGKGQGKRNAGGLGDGKGRGKGGGNQGGGTQGNTK